MLSDLTSKDKSLLRRVEELEQANTSSNSNVTDVWSQLEVCKRDWDEERDQVIEKFRGYLRRLGAVPDEGKLEDAAYLVCRFYDTQYNTSRNSLAVINDRSFII